MNAKLKEAGPLTTPIQESFTVDIQDGDGDWSEIPFKHHLDVDAATNLALDMVASPGVRAVKIHLSDRSALIFHWERGTGIVYRRTTIRPIG